jgi:hypothetical protein
MNGVLALTAYHLKPKSVARPEFFWTRAAMIEDEDRAAAFQPLHIKRHAETVMPEDLQQITALAAKNVQIAGVGIAPQRLLDLQGKAVHAAAHVRRAGCDPDPNSARDRYHRRTSTLITRASAAGSNRPRR